MVDAARLDRGSAGGNSENSGAVEQWTVEQLASIVNCSVHHSSFPFVLHHFTPSSLPMSWHGIDGHDDVVEQFRRALVRGRLASSFLFAGPAGIGKRTFALKLAQAMLCQTRPEEALDPCGACPSCVQVAAGTHPDLDVVAKPDDKSFIPLELLIGEREHRRREGLCHNIGHETQPGRTQDRRDRRRRLPERRGGQLAAENPRRAAAPLGADPDRHQSGQAASDDPLALPTDSLSAAADRDGCGVAGVEGVRGRSGRSRRGWPGTAKGACNGRWNWPIPSCGRSATRCCEAACRAGAATASRLAQTVAAFVDEAGKEASARRARLRQVVAFAAEFYRQLLHAQCGICPLGRPRDADARRPGDRARARRSGAFGRTARSLSGRRRPDRPQRQPVDVDRVLAGRSKQGLGKGLGIRD